MSFNIIPVASEYQEIHPYSVVNVSNVKINTKMMGVREVFRLLAEEQPHLKAE